MERIASTVGAIVSPLPALAVFVPYVLLPTGEAAGLGQYYGFGLVTPWIVAIGGVVAAVAFVSGRQERADPATVAGATLAVGVLMAVLALQWALAVDPVVLQSITSATWMNSHRWAVVATSVPVPLAAGWYARTLDLF